MLNDLNRIDEPALTALGSRGVLRLADGAVQVVVGPIADQLASDIRAQLRMHRPDRYAADIGGPGARQRVVGALGGAANLREVRGNVEPAARDGA